MLEKEKLTNRKLFSVQFSSKGLSRLGNDFSFKILFICLSIVIALHGS